MSTLDGTATAGVSQSARRYTLIMLTVVYTSNFIDRNIINILVEPIKNEFGVSDTMMGLLTGFMFAIFYATLGMPIAMLADRTNRKNVITGALTIWSVMTAVCGLAQNYWQLAAARIGVGIGEAGGSPPAHSMIADLFKREERVSAMAIYSTGIHIGGALGFFIGGWIAEYYGWRMAFYSVGLPGLLLAVIFYFTVREPKRGEADGMTHADQKLPLAEGFRHLWGSKSLRHAIAGCTLVAFIGYGGVAFGASFLIRSHGMTLSEIATYFAIVAAVFGSGGAILAGRAADKMGEKDARWIPWIVSVTKMTAIPFILVFYLYNDLTVILIVYPLVMALGATYQGSTFSMVQTLSPLRMRSQASAILLFVINLIGLGLGPTFVGAVSDLLHPYTGDESLRYALLGVSMLGIWGAWHYYMAGKYYREDLADAHAKGIG